MHRVRLLSPAVGLLLALWLGAAPPVARGQGPDGAYAEELVAAARARSLAAEVQWLRLGHYQQRLLGGWESQADGPGFFLAEGGKTDPQAELEATLRAFFAPPAAPSEHPQCAFPARLTWLSGQLGIDPARLPRPTCPGLDEYRRRVRARGVTLVFSSYYLQSASSAFGHTLLRLDGAPSPGGGTGRELLDQGVNYAAESDASNALTYAWRGLTGGFKGAFAYQPYYYKVREYGDFESRDLWEYELDLRPEETARLVDHVWELGHTWFDYYYADENCSYHVLSALDVASPRLDLAARTKPIVLPADTVRIVWRTPGLVKAVHRRPSIRSQFRARAAALAPEESDALERVVSAPAAPLPPALAPESQARVLDAAVDWVDYVHAKEILGNVPTPAADAKQALLVRRAALGLPSPEPEVSPEARDAPHDGHDSVRVGLGAGPSSSAWPVVAIDFRLAGHDLADPPGGYSDVDELELARVELQWEPAGPSTFRLSTLTALGIRSLPDFGRFDRHLSWELSVGATTLYDGGCDGCLAGQGVGGVGLAKSLDAGDRFSVFALADLSIQGAPDLKGISGGPVRVGLGPSVGARAVLLDRLVLLATGYWWWLPGATVSSVWGYELTGRVGVGRFAIDLQFRAHPLERLGLARAFFYF